ncbi:MAG: hypothetical protein GY754_02605 [bacterium]|nr:hypothetical protein [bacterium]
MKTKTTYLQIAVVSLIVLIILAIFNMNKVQYYSDWAKSSCIDIFNKIIPENNNFAAANPKLYKKYKKTYNNLPSEFTTAGLFLLYKAPRDMSPAQIARQSIKYTNYYKVSHLAKAISKYNALNKHIKKKSIKKGRLIHIPGSLPLLTLDLRKTKRPELVYTRGLYYTGSSIGSSSLLKRIPSYKKTGVNCIVFDVKDITGIITYRSSVPQVRAYNTDKKKSIDNIQMFLRELKKHNIYSVARIAVFRDHLLVKKEPSLAIRSYKTGGVWNAGSKEIWCDPTNKKVQDYNINLALELANMGVDEIQFDYIRFPTVGKLKDAKYSYDFGKMSKEHTITNFLKRAYTKISAKNTLVSIDVFGVVAWGKNVDIRKTGQRIELLAEYCDIISPMLYPSHFNDDFDGFSNPGDNPYHFIFKGCQKVRELSNNKVLVRPWLQAFKWRVSNYDKHYIMKQVRASDDSGAFGYLFWNARNDYGKVYKALKKI